MSFNGELLGVRLYQCIRHWCGIPDIRYAIHAGPSYTFLHYIQEAGRGGRHGDPTLCMLVDNSQHETYEISTASHSISDPDLKQQLPMYVLNAFVLWLNYNTHFDQSTIVIINTKQMATNLAKLKFGNAQQLYSTALTRQSRDDSRGSTYCQILNPSSSEGHAWEQVWRQSFNSLLVQHAIMQPITGKAMQRFLYMVNWFQVYFNNLCCKTVVLFLQQDLCARAVKREQNLPVVKSVFVERDGEWELDQIQRRLQCLEMSQGGIQQALKHYTLAQDALIVVEPSGLAGLERDAQLFVLEALTVGQVMKIDALTSDW
ncbi:hypothetical protein MP228_011317 [Amoeboaphelidium protococcarum]|nr:hypothetical protein MP228_011317 [Amoeboaphelidium protococcarum]